MSKPKTLLDFFSKSPRNSSPTSDTKSPAAKSPKDNTTKKSLNKSATYTPKSNKENLKSKVKRRTIDSENESENEDENETDETIKPKRRRIVVPSDDDDSADEYKPEKDASVSDDSIPSDVSEDESPKKKRKTSKATSSPSLAAFHCSKNSSNSKQSTPRVNGGKNSSFLKSPAVNAKNSTPISKKKIQVNGTANELEENEQDIEFSKEWLHDNLDWLKDDKIKDKFGKRKLDPEYSARSLYVPESFKKNLTPAMKQWWDMKANHFDTVLFFKVGKFYELYHMDAVIGVKELGLSFMKGEFAHSGFPEIAYGRFSECLVQKGYKVARVEQTETPQMMEERCKNMNRPTKFDKVVNREICQVTTKGTRTLTYQEESMGPENNFLLAICEKHFEDSDNELEYGICFVDTTIGKFSLSQFKDDRHRSRLLTLVALNPPVEIIYERSSVSKITLQLLNNNLSSVPKEALNSGTEFWDSTKVLKYLSEKKYFLDGEKEDTPDVLKNMLDADDRLQQTPLRQYELAFKSLGACIWYLKECLIDDSLITMKLFEEYRPADGFKKEPSKVRKFHNQHMVLDGTTLSNLEIVQASSSENDGSLYSTMNFCSTKFGKRLFRYWLCSPLCDPKSIDDRLNAIEDLMEIPDVVDRVMTGLKKIPDLERMLSKIHSQGLSRSKNHPETRAIFYEANIYNKRKFQDFLSTLDGFKESIEIISQFQNHAENFKSSLLKKCVTTTDDKGSFPNFSDALNYFDHAFNHEDAKKEGNIIPSKGVDNDYDTACAELKNVEDNLEDYLTELKRKFNCKVSYVGSGRTRFQIEIPDNKKVPEDFEFQGARKGFRRFYTDEARGYLARYIAAEESSELALRDVSRRIYAQFDKDYEVWKSAIHCLAVIDVLISLQLYNKSSEVSMCRPEFILPDETTEPFLEIIEGKHPSFLKYFTDDSYIPNSVYIGPEMKEKKDSINRGGRVVLVTGPNMGGKSTLMRQAGALVIMAQVGSFIPAVSMKLTPVDRIFTRVGANDQISKGESTFFVEASETASIIHHATRDSFVLVDELGRGTSTHDGTAIAYSVLDNLANVICCRTLFSTHYHGLVEDFHSHPTVGLGHMACMVEKDDDCPALERITFLYKFINGACPKSYGFNVALLAGISKDVVQKGFVKAQEMECVPRISKLIKKFLSLKVASDIASEIQERIIDSKPEI